MPLIRCRKCTPDVHQTTAPEHWIYKSVDGVHFLDNQARPLSTKPFIFRPTCMLGTVWHCFRVNVDHTRNAGFHFLKPCLGARDFYLLCMLCKGTNSTYVNILSLP